MKNKIRKAMAVLASATIVLSTSSFLPYSNFNLAVEITANAEEHTHNLIYYEAREATCSGSGHLEYWWCQDCNKCFGDEEGKNIIYSYEYTIPSTGHTFSEEYDYNKLFHWQPCEKCDREEQSLHEFTNDNECSECGFSLDKEYKVINGNIIFSDENGTYDESATLDENGYELDKEAKTLTIGNIYINGSLGIDTSAVETIVIAEGANPVASDIQCSSPLKITGKGTLTTEFFYYDNDNSEITVTDGAEVICNNCMVNSIKITDNGKLNVSKMFFIQQNITMDNTSELEMDITTVVFLGSDNLLTEIEQYIPEGYELFVMAAEGVNAGFVVPKGATVKEEESFVVYDKDGNQITGSVTLKKQYEDGIGEHLAGHSLSLDGNIGVNFYMELDTSVIADKNACMKFTLPDGSTSEVKVSEARTEILDGQKYYVFSCSVPAKNIFDKITAQMITSSGEGTEYTYCVSDYFISFYESIYENPEEYDSKAENLANCMTNYCIAAMLYFDYMDKYFDCMEEANDKVISEEERESDKAEFENMLTNILSEVTAETLSGFEPVSTENLPEGVEYYGSSLLLKSNTRIRHYFKVAKGADTSIFTGKKNGYYYIDSESIPAGKLSEIQKTTVGTGYIEYSPMNYAYEVLNSESADENLKNLCKALYMYDQSAKDYQNKSE